MTELLPLSLAAVALLLAALGRLRRLALLRSLRGALAFLGIGALVWASISLAWLPVRWQEWAIGAVLLALGYLVARLVLLVVFEFLLAQRVGVVVPRLARDVAALLLYLVVAAAVLRNAYGMDVGALLATSAVLTVVIGLALQETLGTLLAGLALAWEQRVAAGEWISLGGTVGQIEELGWRTLALRTRLGERVLVPNSQVARERITLLGHGNLAVAVPVRIGVSYEAPPARVKRVLQRVAEDVPGLAPDVPPQVVVAEMADSAVVYEARLWTREAWRAGDFVDAFQTAAWEALGRDGIEIPFPQRTVHLARPKAEAASKSDARARAALAGCPVFAGLPDDALAGLAGASRAQRFAPGESVVREGEVSTALYVVAAGEAVVLHDGREIARVAAGELFGEIAFLLGEPRSATVRAGGQLEVVRVDADALRALLHAHPDLAEDLAARMTARRAALAEREEVGGAPRTTRGFSAMLLERLQRLVG